MRNRMREIRTSGSVRAWRGKPLLATRKRVKNGLANARAKGKILGRKKMRDSHLIRKLLKAGMSMRKIAALAVCSHGSVSAEKKCMLREEADEKAKSAAEALPAVGLAEVSAETGDQPIKILSEDGPRFI